MPALTRACVIHSCAQHARKAGEQAVPPSARPSRPPLRRAAPSTAPSPFDLWDDAAPAAAPAAAAAAAAAKRQRPPRSRAAPAPGVVVCHEGASYNPPTESHQELLGAAVAEEHMKALRAELHPVRPPGARTHNPAYSEGQRCAVCSVCA
jgi:hypothetical protein